jgi:hypothetical protein
VDVCSTKTHVSLCPSRLSLCLFLIRQDDLAEWVRGNQDDTDGPAADELKASSTSLLDKDDKVVCVGAVGLVCVLVCLCSLVLLTALHLVTQSVFNVYHPEIGKKANGRYV